MISDDVINEAYRLDILSDSFGVELARAFPAIDGARKASLVECAKLEKVGKKEHCEKQGQRVYEKALRDKARELSRKVDPIV